MLFIDVQKTCILDIKNRDFQFLNTMVKHLAIYLSAITSYINHNPLVNGDLVAREPSAEKGEDNAEDNAEEG